ncbi:MAG TPA: hypothetical protein DDY37_07090, partial [Legionella sp.]|nr:hypothetical protein [Legionella sp.]
MFFKKTELKPPSQQPSRGGAISDEERVPVGVVQANMSSANRLIHYMADLGHFNAANPHAIPRASLPLAENDARGTGEGVLQETEERDTRSMLKTAEASSLDTLLIKPDKLKHIGFKKDGRPKKDRSEGEKNLEPLFIAHDQPVTLRDWLQKKLSVVAWENDRRYRRIVPHLLAILMENEPEKVNMVQEFIRSISPYTMKTREQSDKSGTYGGFIRGLVSGSNKKTFVAEFDDFTVTNWTRLLCMANEGKIQLNEETKEHIMNHLLVLQGEKFDDAVPNTNYWLVKKPAQWIGFPETDGGIENSENHVLMINGSAYIKNQLMQLSTLSGSDLEIKLCAYLDRIYEKGLSEFNSIPYAGHTIDALLNLHDFAQEPVKSHATRVLDKIFYDYVIHSTRDGKAFRPFSRLQKNEANQDFSVDDQVRAFMTPWLGIDSDYYRKEGQSGYSEYAFSGLTTTYRLPTVVYELGIQNTGGYLALTGQQYGNAEVSYKNNYGNGRQYLLSGGGLRDEEPMFSSTKNIATSLFRAALAREKEDPIAEDALIRTA